MGQRDLDAEPALLLRNSCRETMEPDGGPALGVAGHLDLPPANSPGPGQGLHGLVHSLLSRNSGGSMPSGVRPTGEVLPLTIREQSRHSVLAFVGQKGADPLQVD